MFGEEAPPPSRLNPVCACTDQDLVSFDIIYYRIFRNSIDCTFVLVLHALTLTVQLD